jgi:hypothetical protein
MMPRRPRCPSCARGVELGRHDTSAWTSDDGGEWGRRVSKGEVWRCIVFPVEMRSICESK